MKNKILFHLNLIYQHISTKLSINVLFLTVCHLDSHVRTMETF